ncbi:hypothetical protein PAALTS15_16461 [Paenibacillus alvei TS-15]|jgi:hypothetical protein|uniref:Uncharacterized protein n=1 Tax=Paenibacillus alvei TS-15 TaxID=1117108 RepID=S9SN45_PAEAL|nr:MULTISPECIES: hypothetical protein [Paenibacillus]EPY06089.1 hypothetical protein PAALTS15_16461 [Paenibacillus alvei TS-15]
MSKTSNKRRKSERAGHLDPSLLRGSWTRKPYTQVVPNKKAEQRRSLCRKRVDDGAVVI